MDLKLTAHESVKCVHLIKNVSASDGNFEHY
jgi:hypothetical protein